MHWMGTAQTPEQTRKQRPASRQVERLAHYLTGPCGEETDDCFVRIPLSDGSSVSVTFERLKEDGNNGKPIPHRGDRARTLSMEQDHGWRTRSDIWSGADAHSRDSQGG